MDGKGRQVQCRRHNPCVELERCEPRTTTVAGKYTYADRRGSSLVQSDDHSRVPHFVDTSGARTAWPLYRAHALGGIR
jgi:hypothetical protein